LHYTGIDLSVIWFERPKTQAFVIQRGLGGRLNLSAR
jgi:hypothetical protein